MPKFGLYLVCNEYLEDVRKFLQMFFEESVDEYKHKEWITFNIQNIDFFVNLMNGVDQKLTQNVTFEIYCKTKKDLESYAQKHGTEIQDFLAIKSTQKYRYYYIEISGPKNICKVEISYSEDVN